MKLQDATHYYLGARFWTPNSEGQINEVTLKYVNAMIEQGRKVQLLLRPLSSMTEEEMKECGNLVYDFSNEPELNTWDYRDFGTTLCSEQWDWLIKRHFDLFGLIEKGLAIDASTIHEPSTNKERGGGE